jgi:hypothetical protein
VRANRSANRLSNSSQHPWSNWNAHGGAYNVQVAIETVNHLIVTHEVTIYSSVAEDENHVRLVTALKSGRLSGECGLGMRIGCERPVANSKLLLERNLLEGRLLKTGAYCG